MELTTKVVHQWHVVDLDSKSGIMDHEIISTVKEYTPEEVKVNFKDKPLWTTYRFPIAGTRMEIQCQKSTSSTYLTFFPTEKSVSMWLQK